MDVRFTLIDAEAAARISEAFIAQGWNGREATMQRYVTEQLTGARSVLVAWNDDVLLGYITVIWQAHYEPFRIKNIPEIADFNVFIPYRGVGAGRQLLAEAERLIAEKSPIAGLGVALLPDYGTAQRIYIQGGYLPDGKGVTYNNLHCKYGDEVRTDDDLVLWFVKDLRETK